MRICLASREYPPETAHGGIGTQAYLKAHGLARLGHEVTVLSQSVNAGTHEYLDGPVRVVRIPSLDKEFPIYTEPTEWLSYSMTVAVALHRLNERQKLDLIEFPEYGGEGYVHLLNRTEWNHVPVVIQLHGPLVMFAHAVGWPEIDSDFYRVGTTMEGTCLRLADAIYSSSACSAGWCTRHYGLGDKIIPVLHTGVDTHLFTPKNPGANHMPVVVFAGRITGDKGAGVLARAACQIAPQFPGLRVRFCGRGEESFIQELKALAAAAGQAQLLEFPGFLDRHQLPEVFAKAQVFALPSTHEPGPGLVYLEAMACGLPVIGCTGAGAAEVILEGRNGILVPPNDAGALAGALRRLLGDSDLRQRLAANALDYAMKEADSTMAVQRIENFYRAVLIDSGCARG